MKNYIAFFEFSEGEDGFSVLFPDLPGAISGGADYDDAYRMAHECLAFHLEGLTLEGYPIPEPRSLEKIRSEWSDWDEWEKSYRFFAVPIAAIPANEKSVRVNVVLPEGTLCRIDRVAKNRSAFLAMAAKRMLDENLYENEPLAKA
jgi:predicted RNase H-like HicB family nuclease